MHQTLIKLHIDKSYELAIGALMHGGSRLDHLASMIDIVTKLRPSSHWPKMSEMLNSHCSQRRLPLGQLPTNQKDSEGVMDLPPWGLPCVMSNKLRSHSASRRSNKKAERLKPCLIAYWLELYISGCIKAPLLGEMGSMGSLETRLTVEIIGL